MWKIGLAGPGWTLCPNRGLARSRRTRADLSTTALASPPTRIRRQPKASQDSQQKPSQAWS